MHAYTYLSVYLFSNLHVCTCMHMQMVTSVSTYIHRHVIDTQLDMQGIFFGECVCVSLYIYIFVCAYEYIYTGVHIPLYTNIYKLKHR